MDLKKLRRKIDDIDKKIVSLLNERADVTLNISDLKLKSGQNVYSPERERQVLRKITAESRGRLSGPALEAIYREIMSASLALKKQLNIAYLGPEATFTHLAAIKRFGSLVNYVALSGIGDIFLEVERGSVDYGVVPIENSIEGAVSHTLDLLVDSDLKICAQVILDVSHNLLANCAKERIKRVYSKAEVFGQCRYWLRQNLPAAELIEVSSTTRAAEIAAKTRDGACIASALAARVYKLRVLAMQIEDSPHNVTRFLVIGKTDAEISGKDKTSIVFSVNDKVGALHDMLVPFKKYGINLTKIESRPSKKKAWDYYFFVDLQGHRNDARVKRALLELEGKCKFLKILGSYPVGE